jgi:hypothetical protein
MLLDKKKCNIYEFFIMSVIRFQTIIINHLKRLNGLWISLEQELTDLIYIQNLHNRTYIDTNSDMFQNELSDICHLVSDFFDYIPEGVFDGYDTFIYNCVQKIVDIRNKLLDDFNIQLERPTFPRTLFICQSSVDFVGQLIDIGDIVVSMTRN